MKRLLILAFILLASVSFAQNKILCKTGYKLVKNCHVGDSVLAYDVETGRKFYNAILTIDTVYPQKQSYLINPKGYLDRKGQLVQQMFSDSIDSTFRMHHFIENTAVFDTIWQNTKWYTINGVYHFYAEQSLWANVGVTHVKRLEIGDTLYSDLDKDIIITSISSNIATAPFIRFSISGDHSYIADGVTLHNASRYWVGGSGTWSGSDQTHWSSSSNGSGGSSVPTGSDAVIIDENSGSGTMLLSNSGIALPAASILQTNGTGTCNITGNLANTLTSYGSVTFLPGKFSGTASMFIYNSSTCNIALNDNSIGALTFGTGTGGIYTLTSNSTVTGVVTLAVGTLVTGAYNHTWQSFASANSSTIRNVDVSNSTINITLSGGGNGWGWKNESSNSMCTSNTNSTVTFLSQIDRTGLSPYFGSVFRGTVRTTYQGYIQLWDATTFHNFTFDGTAETSSIMQLILTNPIVIDATGSLTLKGGADNRYRLLIKSSILGTSELITLTSGSSYTMLGVDFKDIKFASIIDLSSITQGSGDCQGNTNIIFTPAQSNYYKADNGNWSDASKWFLSDHTTAGRSPLPQDNAIFDSYSFTTTGKAVTVDVPRLGKNIDFSAVTAGRNPAWTYGMPNSTIELYGDVRCVAGMTNNGEAYTTQLSLAGRGTQYLDFKGFGTIQNIYLNAPNGTYLLLSDFLTYSTLALNYGTFDCNGYNITEVYGLNAQGATTKALYLRTGIIHIDLSMAVDNNAYFTFNAGTSTINFNYSSGGYAIAAGNGLTFYNVNFLLSSTTPDAISGNNTFNTFSCHTSRNIQFSVGVIETFNKFDAAGIDATHMLTIGTSSTFALRQSSGVVNCDFMNISNSTAAGGAQWNAGLHSVNGGGNSGWLWGSGNSIIVVSD